MAHLLISNAGMADLNVPLNRLRTTIGRSARSDVCIPDAFASRLHAEVRKEGDAFWLHDLGSANGTRYFSDADLHGIYHADGTPAWTNSLAR